MAAVLQKASRLLICGIRSSNRSDGKRPVGRLPHPPSPAALLDELAALPVSTWRYKWDDPDVRHLGPMAQDFAAAFGLGENERWIETTDADGVNMVAIQEVTRRLRALRGSPRQASDRTRRTSPAVADRMKPKVSAYDRSRPRPPKSTGPPRAPWRGQRAYFGHQHPPCSIKGGDSGGRQDRCRGYENDSLYVVFDSVGQPMA